MSDSSLLSLDLLKVAHVTDFIIRETPVGASARLEI